MVKHNESYKLLYDVKYNLHIFSTYIHTNIIRYSWASIISLADFRWDMQTYTLTTQQPRRHPMR